MNKNIKFISLMRDFTFKTLWVKGSENSKKFLNRIISNLVGYDTNDFILGMNELGANSYKSLANRLDILLCSKDNYKKINVELNSEYKKVIVNKNDSYIYKLAGEFYSGMENSDKYKMEIDVEQVNINGFLNRTKKSVAISHYVSRDLENDLIRKGIKFHDVYLPNIKEMCYDGCDEIYKDLAMFTAKSYEEMESLAKGNKERETIMKELKRLGSDEEFVDLYDHDEFDEILLQSYKDDARAEGRAEGIAEGIEQGKLIQQIEIAKNLKAIGMSIEEIATSCNLSFEEVNNI